MAPSMRSSSTGGTAGADCAPAGGAAAATHNDASVANAVQTARISRDEAAIYAAYTSARGGPGSQGLLLACRSRW